MDGAGGAASHQCVGGRAVGKRPALALAQRRCADWSRKSPSGWRCPRSSAGYWPSAASISIMPRGFSRPDCATSCRTPHICATWMSPPRGSSAPSATAKPSLFSAITMSTAPPPRRCWRGSSRRSASAPESTSRTACAKAMAPTASALRRLRAEGARVVVTVDCGTTAHLPLAEAAENGLEIIVVDHHVAEPLLPRAAAVINPNRLDEDEPAWRPGGGRRRLSARCRGQSRAAPGRLVWRRPRRARPARLARPGGAGHGLRRRSRWSDSTGRLVAQGIKVARRGGNPGMAALAAIAGVKEPLDAYHLGFRARPAGQCRRPGRRRRSRRAVCWPPTTRPSPPNWRSVLTATIASAGKSKRAPLATAIARSKRRRNPRF